MGKIVITEKKQKLLLFLMEQNDHPLMLRGTDLPDTESLVGNIYVGRIQKLAEGMKAAFVTISRDKTVFLPLEEHRKPLLCNREYDGVLKTGDELLVQITAPAMKTKLPSASCELSLTGQYCVCSRSGHGIRMSGRLSGAKGTELKNSLSELMLPGLKQYGFVIRTNAGELEELSPLLEEMQKFADFFDELSRIYKKRSLYSCLYCAEPGFVTLLRDIPLSAYDEIITDLPCVAELLDARQFPGRVRLYQDEMLSLSALYSLDSHLQQILSKKVWLPGGGFLVIEPTEAMVVIDVNSGKGSGAKNGSRKNLYLSTNLEAAEEIARQLQLRNYSGMIMVDFISMDKKEEKQELLTYLDACLRKDRVATRLVDMTALGIVEITRQKLSAPLHEVLK